MKLIKQTKFGDKNGNCMQACIASLLNLDIEDVPEFSNLDTWWTEFREWAGRLGYSPIEVNWPLPEGFKGQHIFPNSGQVCWAVGKSPRGHWLHTILVRWQNNQWEVFHDPHPDNQGLEIIDLVGMLVPFMPCGEDLGKIRVDNWFINEIV